MSIHKWDMGQVIGYPNHEMVSMQNIYEKIRGPVRGLNFDPFGQEKYGDCGLKLGQVCQNCFKLMGEKHML